MALIDMGFKGNRFTWRRGRVEQNYVAKRLDRVFCCPHLRIKWQEATVSHLPFMASDHAPVYVQLSPAMKGNPGRRPFRFEAAWLSHESFKEMLTLSWQGDLKTREALQRLRWKLKEWNKEVFGNVQQKKDRLVGEIKVVQDLLDIQQTDDLLEKEAVLVKEFETVLEQEELIWFQKSREKWIHLGDRNTKYFHTSTVIRRRRNRIEALKDDEGRWIHDSTELEKMAVAYYKRLYSMDDIDQFVDKLPSLGFDGITSCEEASLNVPFSANLLSAMLGDSWPVSDKVCDGFF